MFKDKQSPGVCAVEAEVLLYADALWNTQHLYMYFCGCGCPELLMLFWSCDLLLWHRRKGLLSEGIREAGPGLTHHLCTTWKDAKLKKVEKVPVFVENSPSTPLPHKALKKNELRKKMNKSDSRNCHFGWAATTKLDGPSSLWEKCWHLSHKTWEAKTE